MFSQLVSKPIQVQGQVKYQVLDQVSSDQVWLQVQGQDRLQVSNQVWLQVSDQVWDRVYWQLVRQFQFQI